MQTTETLKKQGADTLTEGCPFFCIFWRKMHNVDAAGENTITQRVSAAWEEKGGATLAELLHKRRFIILLVMVALASSILTIRDLQRLLVAREPFQLRGGEGAPEPSGSGAEIIDGTAGEPALTGSELPPVQAAGDPTRYYLGIKDGYIGIFCGDPTLNNLAEMTDVPEMELSEGDIEAIKGGEVSGESEAALREMLEGLNH
jgi:hypothetical protein